MTDKYYVEAYSHYYPSGGMLDISEESFDTPEEAAEEVKSAKLFNADCCNLIRVRDNVMDDVAEWEIDRDEEHNYVGGHWKFYGKDNDEPEA